MRIPHGLRAALAGSAGAATDADFENTVLLLHGDGTNGAQNNTFTDGSTNNFTITRNGNTTQGTFTPFGDNWSNYFDGTGDYLSFAKQTTTSSFTCECWFYRGEDVGGYHILFSGSNLGSINADNVQLSVSNTGGVSLTLAGSGIIAATGTAVTKNQWNHIAWVRSGTSCAIFVNGNRIATGTSSSALNVVSVGTYLASYIPIGYISNARITTTAVYDPSLTTYTVPTAPLTAITGTYLLTCQSNRFVDNSASPLTITVNGNPSVQRFSPFAPTAAYSTSTIGGSGYFDGSGDYLTAAASASFDLGGGDFTVEGWYYVLSTTANPHFFQFTTNSTSRWNIYRNTNFYLYSAINGAETNANTGDAVPLNEWFHLAVVKSSTTTRVYLNGNEIYSDSRSFPTGNAAFSLGYQENSGAAGDYLAGWASNFRIVKGTAVYTSNFTPPTSPLTAITNTSLLLNFTNGAIIDNAMMNNLETVGNAQISTSTKKFGTGALYFDGTGDYLTLPSSINYAFGTGSFTIEAWVYPTALGNIDFLSFTDDRTNVGFTSGGAVNYYDGTAQATGNSVLSTNAWTHVAITKSGTAMNIWINGTSQKSFTSTYDAGAAARKANLAARFDGSGNFFTGYVDDFRITKGVARYTANFTPPTSAFADR
jgi:hypothetical protein